MKITDSKIKLILAFLTIYLVWGSTYFAIRIAIKTLPPFLMASSRYLLAALILSFFASRKEKGKIDISHWRSAFIVGGLLFLGGNGGVVWSQQFVPSSIAALVIATIPLWTVLIEWKRNPSKKMDWKIFLGLFFGFLGLWLLLEDQTKGQNHFQVKGILVLILAALSWAIGSIYARQALLPSSPILTNAMEMFAGGIWLAAVSLLTGDWKHLHLEKVSISSILAVGYLVIFGALIGFTAYKYILKHTTPTLAATYAYVNPVVAIFLGWFFAGETFNFKMLIGAGIILAGVFLITISKTSKSDFQAKTLAATATGRQ